ncbi:MULTISPECIES: hypothetical protein [Blautia]
MAKLAIQQFGSIEKYAEEMKHKSEAFLLNYGKMAVTDIGRNAERR